LPLLSTELYTDKYVVAIAYNPRTREVEAGGSPVQSQPEPLSATLSQKKKKKKERKKRERIICKQNI
jgi:hypothetical protein